MARKLLTREVFIQTMYNLGFTPETLDELRRLIDEDEQAAAAFIRQVIKAHKKNEKNLPKNLHN